MRFLPIIERELRVAAHRRATWWRRVLTFAVALIVLGLCFWSVSQWAAPNWVGRQLFSALASVSFIYALLVGPMATADCLGRERRNGTLGLLFLTRLRSYDVVLGKMMGASLDMALTLAAIIPAAALPVLIGGVSIGQFALTALALLNVLFLSLSVGVCFSAFLANGRASLALTCLFLLFLTLGLPFLGEELLKLRSGTSADALFYMFCPLDTLQQCFEVFQRVSRRKYQLDMLAQHALAWLCLILACLATRRAWRDLPVSIFGLRWRERLERWRRGSPRSRQTWRRAALNLNPVCWLDCRDRFQPRLLWGLILATGVLWACKIMFAWDSWVDSDVALLWPLLVHYVLCFWLAVRAPRRFADDKESGALELLLCAPIGASRIVRGAMGGLRRRFGRALVAMLLMDLFLVYAYLSESGERPYWRDDVFQLAVCGLLVFPVQANAFARVGLYQGLVSLNSLRATFMLVWKLWLLPWLLFLLSILLMETVVRRALGRFFSFPSALAYGLWAACHLLPCAVFLAQASWELHANFRSLAATPHVLPWWRRAWRFLLAARADFTV